jgi:hypothetical protein
MVAVSIYTELPQVIEILGLEDSGEFGNARCPHCGAEGRYVYHFTCADGTTRGAMKGCFSHFPKHRYAQRMARIAGKENDLRGSSRTLASWDLEVAEAIRAFADGTLSEVEVDRRLWHADAQKNAWMKRRGYR